MILTFLLLLLFSNGLTVRPDTSILYSRIGLLIIFYSMISTILSFHITYLQTGIGLYGGLFNVTPITHSFQIFILLVCGIILLMTGFYPRKKHNSDSTSFLSTLSKKIKEYASIINKVSEQFTIIEYALIIIFVITGATLLLASGDLGSIYLCIELQSFSLYIISAMHRNSESSTGSALTYFLLGGLSSCFILLGVALIYANSGLTNLDGIYSIISDSEIYLNFSTWYMHTYIFYSFLLISVGFLFKIAAAPFHWWSPDVYDGVPTIVTTFIAILGKISILVIFLELSHYTSTLIYSMIQIYSWTISLSISCFFSLVIGTVLGLTQTRIKRLLAYSTISHIGFVLLALIVHNIESYEAFIFYIMQYILTNLNAFLVIIAIGFSLYLYHTNISENNNLSEKNNSPIQLISQLKGYFSINPVLALCLVINMFSFVGLPPLTGFFAKQMVLTSALDNNNSLLVIVGILTSVIGAVYYLSVIKTMYFYKSDYKKSYKVVQVSLSNYLCISLAILTLAISLFILIPNEPLNLCNLLASCLSETVKYDSDSLELRIFFNNELSSDNSLKYKDSTDSSILLAEYITFTILCARSASKYIIYATLCIILAGIDVISILFMNLNAILNHQPIFAQFAWQRNDRVPLISLGYTVLRRGNNINRIIFDQGQREGTRLKALYTSINRDFIQVDVIVNGIVYTGLQFTYSRISGSLVRPSLLFRHTQHNTRDGIWVPKPRRATRMPDGSWIQNPNARTMLGRTRVYVLANGWPVTFNNRNDWLFIPGGVDNT